MFFEWTTAEFIGTSRSLGMTAPQNSAAVTDVTFQSMHRKGYQSKLLFFHSKGGRCSFWACFTAMTGDRHDERAAMDFSMIIFAQTPSWLEWILTVMPVWLYFSSFLFCFLTLNFIYYTSVSCVWLLLPYVSLQSNWAWKSLKLGMSILFFLWGFSYLLTF